MIIFSKNIIEFSIENPAWNVTEQKNIPVYTTNVANNEHIYISFINNIIHCYKLGSNSSNSYSFDTHGG